MEEKYKVLHLVPGMASGGVAKMVQEWFDNKNNDSITFDIATINILGLFSDDLKNKGCKIMVFEPLRNVGLIRYISQLNKIIKQGNYDIVHSHMGLLSFIAFIISIRHGIKSRFLHAHTNLFHNDDKNGLKRMAINILKYINVIFATNYLACTNEAGEYFFGNHILGSSKYNLLLNGINVDKFSYSIDKRNQLRKQFDVEDKFIIGNIGRLSAQKNQKFILEIFEHLSRIEKNTELWLIGEGEDEIMLKNLCRDLGINDKVKFLGVRKDVENYLLCMDVFLMPSLYEGLGIVAIEAQVSGLGCVLSNMVPKEVNVTNNVIFNGFNNPIEKWVNSILEFRKYNRIDQGLEVKKSGYDIKGSTNLLLKIYESSI